MAGIADSLGRPPQHTFFFPLEEYRPRMLDRLAGLCHRGFGEVEVHLHHDRDTSEQSREKLEWFKQTLHHEHGLLHRDQQGQVRYGFIHGNWALDNSHPDGCWCGVNDELTILRETGCYADFTMPAAPDPAQTRTINSIYYAVDDPSRPKSHDVGTPACVGGAPPTDGLLMIQGPLALDWGDRKYGILPRLENASLHARRPPSASRLNLWQRAAVGVQGRPEWTFVKLHTHGAKPANADVLLGPPMRELHRALAQRGRAERGFRYYYVTAREMARLVHAAEAGITEPGCVLQKYPLPPGENGKHPLTSFRAESKNVGRALLPCLHPRFSTRPCQLAWQERQLDGLETISHHHPPPASLSGRSASSRLRLETDSPAAQGGRGLGALLRSISLALQTGPPA